MSNHIHGCKTDVHELRYALAASSAVASAIGISFKDTNTALAVFAQNGLKGSDAGTSLKTMLLNLQPTTEKQISLFQTLGLMTADGANQFFTAEGKAKSLADISGVLQKSLGGLSDQERLLALEMLFGSDAIRAANILYKEGEKGLTDMSSAMGKVTAADVAKEKLNNLSGSVEQFKGSVETASINLGEFTQGPLKALVDFGTNAVNSFNSINPAIQQFILIIGGILAAIGPVLIGIGFLIDAIAKIGAAFAFVQGTAFAASLAGIGAVLGPLLPIILGIAAAVGLMYLFFDTIKGPINDFLGLLGLVNGEGTKTVSTFDLIGQFFSALGTAIMTALADPLRRIADLWRQLGEALAPLAPLLPPIGEALKVVGAVVGGVLVGAFVLFLGILTAVVSAIISVIGGIVQFFTGITQVVTGFFGWLIAIFTGNTQQAQELWNQMGQGIYNTFSGFIKVITLGIGQFVKTIIAFFQSLYMTLVGGSIVPDMITAIIGWFFQLPGAVGSAVVSMITAAVNGFNNLWNNIVSTVSKWPGMLYDWGRKIIQSFVDGIASMAGAVVSAITNVLDKAKGLVKGNSPPPEGPFKHIDQWGFNVGMAWSDGLTSAIGSIESLVTGDVNMGNIRQPAPAFSSVPNQTTNSPVFNISLGNFLGTETEFREFSRSIVKAYENYQKGAGESIVD